MDLLPWDSSFHHKELFKENYEAENNYRRKITRNMLYYI